MQADLNKTKQQGHLLLRDKLENYNGDWLQQFASIYPRPVAVGEKSMANSIDRQGMYRIDIDNDVYGPKGFMFDYDIKFGNMGMEPHWEFQHRKDPVPTLFLFTKNYFSKKEGKKWILALLGWDDRKVGK